MPYSSKVQQQASRERVSQLLQASTGRLVRDLGVDLHRDAELGMTEDGHRHTRVDVEIGQQRAARSAAVMHADLGHTSFHDASVPRPVEVAWVDWTAEFGGEHQTVLFPGVSGSLLVLIATNQTLLECRAHDGRERKCRVIRLRRLGLAVK